MAKYSSYQVSLITGRIFESLSYDTLDALNVDARAWSGQLNKTLIIYTMNTRSFSMPVRFAGLHAQEWAALMATVYRFAEIVSTPKGWTHVE